jgi:hypothetical protein
VKKRQLKEFKSLVILHKGSEAHPPAIDKEKFEERKATLARSYIQDLREILSTTVFEDKAWYSCSDMCFVSPRSDPRFRAARWSEIGGHTCCPWSAIGSQNNLLDPATLPTMVWGFSTRYYEPDDIISECTPLFKPESWDPIWGDPADVYRMRTSKCCVVDKLAEDMPKHPLSRPLAAGESARSRTRFSQWYAPWDLGLPNSRKRVYSWHHLRNVLLLNIPEKELGELFRRLFFWKCVADATIYLKVSEDIHAAHVAEWASKRADVVCLADGPEGLGGTDPLPTGQYGREGHSHLGPFCRLAFRLRLRKFEIQHQRAQEGNRVPCPVQLVNLMQTADFALLHLVII